MINWKSPNKEKIEVYLENNTRYGHKPRLEKVAWSLWHRQVITQGTIVFFRGDSSEDTNLNSMGFLPDPQFFEICSISIFLSRYTQKKDFFKFLDDFYFYFLISNKYYIEQPVQSIMRYNQYSILVDEKPLLISPNEDFYAKVEAKKDPDIIVPKCSVCLNGYMYRPVL